MILIIDIVIPIPLLQQVATVAVIEQVEPLATLYQ